MVIQSDVFGVRPNCTWDEGGGILVDVGGGEGEGGLGGGDGLGVVIVTFCFGWRNPPGNPCKICTGGAVACSCGYPKLLRVALAVSCLLAGFGILAKRMLGLIGGS